MPSVLPSPRRRTTAVLAGAVGVAIVTASLAAAPAADAATTTVAVPSTPYARYVDAMYGETTPLPVSQTATTVAVTLPTEAAALDLTSVSYSFVQRTVGDPQAEGTAVLHDGTATITLPTGFLDTPALVDWSVSFDDEQTTGPGGPPGGYGEFGGYGSFLGLNGTLQPTAAVSGSTVALDLPHTTPDAGTFETGAAYWAVPSPALAFAPGDSLTVTAADGSVFQGATPQTYLQAGQSSGIDSVPMTSALSGGSVTSTLASGADVSDFLADGSGIGEVDSAFTSGTTTNYVSVPVTVVRDHSGPAVTRVAGSGRYETSVALAKQGYPTTAPVVYVATGTNFPDALGAASAAAKQGGPLLLTDPSTLPTVVSDEIRSLEPGKIVVVGGPSAVSASVFAALQQLAPSVVRLAGGSRYETDQAVTANAFGTSAHEVYIATGLNYPDALSASAAAGAAGDPVVLVNGSAPSLDAGTAAFLRGLGATTFLVAGGPNAVSTGVAADLAKLGTVTRYAGASRYETSQLINQARFSSPAHAYVATGTGFADALSGAALAGSQHAPLYVVQPTCIPAADAGTLASAAAVTLIGGTSALSANVAALGRCS